MKTGYRRAGAMLLAAAMLCAVAFSAPVSEAKTDETDGVVEQLAVVTADGELCKSPLALYSTASTIRGHVVGDGVKLRKSPSSSGTVLELMYYGEVVKIDTSKRMDDWYYLTRSKTGTKGYASKKYVQVG